MTNDLGTLVVVVLKARNLPDKHTFYKQDVFGQIQIHDVTKKTAVDIKGGQHPVWDEELRVPVPAKASDVTRTLHVSCWSQESRGPEEIGKGKVDITETLKTGEFDDWVPLEVDGKYRGEMYLEMTFYAAGPPPALSRRPSKLLPKDRLAKPSQPYTYGAGKHTAPLKSKSPLLKDAALPPLPEESDPATPAAIPSILRAGQPPASPPKQPYAPFNASSPPRSPQPAPASLRPGRPESRAYAATVPALPREPQPATSAAYPPPFLRPGRPQSGDYGFDPVPPSDPYSNNEPRPFFPIPEVPQAPPARPYPYNYAPPPRDPDLDAPQPQLGHYHQHTHRPSYSLPDEPEGVSTPTPANPYGYVSAPKRFSSYGQTPASSGPGQSHAPPPPRRTEEQANKDRMLALALEREEEERRNYLAEQEQRDLELAKKLDMELNLEEERGSSETVLTGGRTGAHMPGAW